MGSAVSRHPLKVPSQPTGDSRTLLLDVSTNAGLGKKKRKNSGNSALKVKTALNTAKTGWSSRPLCPHGWEGAAPWLTQGLTLAFDAQEKEFKALHVIASSLSKPHRSPSDSHPKNARDSWGTDKGRRSLSCQLHPNLNIPWWLQYILEHTWASSFYVRELWAFQGKTIHR